MAFWEAGCGDGGGAAVTTTAAATAVPLSRRRDGDGGSSLAAAATAARCGDCIVARRRCDETFGAGARTDGRPPRYSSAECAGAFVCLQRPERPS
jgi:hypothetical protein